MICTTAQLKSMPLHFGTIQIYFTTALRHQLRFWQQYVRFETVFLPFCNFRFLWCFYNLENALGIRRGANYSFSSNFRVFNHRCVSLVQGKKKHKSGKKKPAIGNP